jgi:Ca2+/Na+ antiporter
MRNKISLLMIIGGIAALTQTILGHYNVLTIITILCCLCWFVICTYESAKE